MQETLPRKTIWSPRLRRPPSTTKFWQWLFRNNKLAFILTDLFNYVNFFRLLLVFWIHTFFHRCIPFNPSKIRQRPHYENAGLFLRLGLPSTLIRHENAALFLRLGLPSTLIRHETELFQNALKTEGIWKRRIFVFLLASTENILKT